MTEKEKAISIIKSIIDYNDVGHWGRALRHAVKELEEKLTSDNSDYQTLKRPSDSRKHCTKLTNKENKMKIGLHKYHNGLPQIFRYIIPRWLNSITWKAGDIKIYKWMWFSISFGNTSDNSSYETPQSKIATSKSAKADFS